MFSLSMPSKNSQQTTFWNIFLIFSENRFDNSCKLSPMYIICMKVQSLFSKKKKKKKMNLPRNGYCALPYAAYEGSGHTVLIRSALYFYLSGQNQQTTNPLHFPNFTLSAIWFRKKLHVMPKLFLWHVKVYFLGNNKKRKNIFQNVVCCKNKYQHVKL